MSHDIRTLLSGIIGYLNIEDYRKATPEVMKEDRKKVRVARSPSGWKMQEKKAIKSCIAGRWQIPESA